jgi:hypothetical protein
MVADLDQRAIVAMVVRKPGPWGSRRLLPLAAVAAWTLAGPTLAAQKLPSRREAADLSSGRGILEDPLRLAVFTDSARPLGSICDVTFDGESGIIESIDVSAGIVADIAAGSRRVPREDIVRMSAAGAQVVLPLKTQEGTGTKISRQVGRGAGKAFGHMRRAAKRALDKLEKLEKRDG